MSIPSFKQFLEAKQLLLFDPNPEKSQPAKIIKPSVFDENEVSRAYDKIADRGGMSHAQIMKVIRSRFKLRENHGWSEFNYRFGEDRSDTCKKSKKLRKRFGMPANMPGDDSVC